MTETPILLPEAKADVADAISPAQEGKLTFYPEFREHRTPDCGGVKFAEWRPSNSHYGSGR